LESLRPTSDAAVIVTDPAAPTFRQADAHLLSRRAHVVFLCGHYEGIDHRVRQSLCTHAFSIGDYILTNGELPSLVMADAIVRLLPGVLGNAGSLEADSHSDGLLSAPNYTRPVRWRDMEVPDVLRSGDHRAIARWRREQALAMTAQFRPDLLVNADLDRHDLDVLSSVFEPKRELPHASGNAVGSNDADSVAADSAKEPEEERK
jgi:tRNA (guanine37-N1)-methyltransferase